MFAEGEFAAGDADGPLRRVRLRRHAVVGKRRVVHAVVRDNEGAAPPRPRPGQPLHAYRKVSTISVGSVGLSGEFIAAFAGEASQPASIENLLERMDRDEFDLIAVGRALIVDPDWVAKVREGRFGDLRAFDRKALAVLA